MISTTRPARPGNRGHSRGAPEAKPQWVVIAGTLMMALSLVWLITDQLLVGYLPWQWGTGPNIGRGLILLCTYLLLAAGIAIVALSGGFEVRFWRWPSWVAGGTILALLVVFAFVKIVKPRDEEAGLVGRLGISVSPAGDPILVLAVCRGSVDAVRVVGPYRSDRPDEPNELLASYEADQSVRGLRSSIFCSQVTVGRRHLGCRTATSMSNPSSLSPRRVPKLHWAAVSFDRSDLGAVAPAEVLQGQGPSAHRRPLTEFLDAACSAER